VFSESLRTHEVLSRAFAQAVKEAPSASGGDLAHRAVEIASAELTLDIDPALGYPYGFFRTLPGYLQLARKAAAG
jgi:hypothetical protein